ncbi:MAG: heavy metal translocating P-type ATPase metal-binding domain-containing protein [Bdellovibrionota bacterium]
MSARSVSQEETRKKRLVVTYSRSKPHSKLETAFCTHCGKEVLDRVDIRETSPVFCCLGCKTVYQFLQSSGLSRFYQLKQNNDRQIQPGGGDAIEYRYLDDSVFREKYARGLEDPQIDFFVEGVHCAACIWLIEKLPEIVPDVKEAKLDLGKSVASIKVAPGGSFAKAAEKLAWLGYRPHPIESDEKASELQNAENRSWLMRIGVAAACSGNIMLLAVALYAGLAGDLARYFRYLSLALFLPVLFYSAAPFYKNAIASLRSRTLSIDVPVILAIVLGAVVSAFNLRNETDHIYFDSISALVFLLLSSRYVLRRIQQRNLGGSHLYHFLLPSKAKRLDVKAAAIVEVNTAALLPGDLVEVGPGDVIPVDGTVQSGTSAINSSLLTGESSPHRVCPGSQVYSGTLNESDVLQIKVTALGRQTRLGRILKQIEEGGLKKAPIVIAADRVSKWFLAAVFVGAAIVFGLGADFSDGINRALALIIVTCPCALALATPLAMSLSLKKAARAGILINGAEILEKVARVKNVVLDKTGTLTYGKFEVLEWKETSHLHREIADIVVALEEQSKHPVAKSLVQFLKTRGSGTSLPVASFKEEIGVGVSGLVNGQFYEVRSLKEIDRTNTASVGTRIGVYCETKLIATALLGDKIRVDAKTTIDELNRFRLNSFILSGDDPEVVRNVGETIGIATNRHFSVATPEYKSRFVKNHEPCLMAGDGANDALALSSAYVGVAVHGSMDVSLRAADVYIAHPGVRYIEKLVVISKETMSLIHRNFAFSLAYNLVGGVTAASGHMTPLLAALLMPVSAFTVFGSTLIGTRKLREALRERGGK